MMMHIYKGMKGDMMSRGVMQWAWRLLYSVPPLVLLLSVLLAIGSRSSAQIWPDCPKSIILKDNRGETVLMSSGEYRGYCFWATDIVDRQFERVYRCISTDQDCSSASYYEGSRLRLPYWVLELVELSEIAGGSPELLVARYFGPNTAEPYGTYIILGSASPPVLGQTVEVIPAVVGDLALSAGPQNPTDKAIEVPATGD